MRRVGIRLCLVLGWSLVAIPWLPAQPADSVVGKHDGVVSALAFSPNGSAIVSSGHEDRTIRVWDLATGKERLRYTGHGTWAMCARFSPDGKKVASTALEETIRIWDAATGKDLLVINAAPHPFGVNFSPDGKMLATAGHDRTVRLWEIATGKQVYSLGGFDGRIWQVAFSPDGKMLAFSCEDGITRIVDAASGKERHQLRGGDVHCCAIAWSPDGALLASGGEAKTIWLWDATTGKQRGRLVGHGDQITSVAFSPDGRHLVSSAYREAGVRLWELASGAEVRKFAGHAPWPDAVAYAPDGRTVASAGRDGTVRAWDVTGLAGQKPPRDLPQLYRDLIGEDAIKAHAASWALVNLPEATVDLLRDRMKASSQQALPPARLSRLIADLDDDDFEIREKATTELQSLGESAEGALRQALEKPASAEVRRRVEQLLDRLTGRVVPSFAVPVVRSLTVLERLGTPAARALLAEIARGPAGDWATREAGAVLRRLDRR